MHPCREDGRLPAVAIETCAGGAGAAEFLEFFPQFRMGAVERDARVVGGQPEGGGGGGHRVIFEIDPANQFP
jgi:hypothetical protein